MTQEIKYIPTCEIRPGDNDRHTFAQGPLQELAASIAANDLAQPITVRPMWECTECGTTFPMMQRYFDQCPGCDCKMSKRRQFYEIVAGERRFRA